MIKYVIFSGRTDYSKAMFADLNGEENVLFEAEFKRPIIKILNIVHTSCKSNRYIKLPLQNIWYKYYLHNLNKSIDKILFLFCEENRLCYDVNYLKYIKKNFPNSSLVFFPVNCMNEINKRYHSLIFNYYDKVVTFDKNDADKYGWIFYGRVFSKNYIETNINDPIYDVFYAGSNSGRLETIHNIYCYLRNQGFRCLFFIMDVDKKDQLQTPDIIYNQKLSYKQILEYDGKSKCILEVVRRGQSGCTLRMAESILLNKKLITNNENARFEPDYSQERVLIFKSLKDISYEFINLKMTTSDNNNLSPLKMLEYVYEII